MLTRKSVKIDFSDVDWDERGQPFALRPRARSMENEIIRLRGR